MAALKALAEHLNAIEDPTDDELDLHDEVEARIRKKTQKPKGRGLRRIPDMPVPKDADGTGDSWLGSHIDWTPDAEGRVPGDVWFQALGVQRVLEQDYTPWREGLTDEMSAAMNAYGVRDEYGLLHVDFDKQPSALVNGALRAGQPVPQTRRLEGDELDEALTDFGWTKDDIEDEGLVTEVDLPSMVQQLDAATEAGKLQRNVLTYRGINGDAWPALEPLMRPGAEFVDNGFVSTSPGLGEGGIWAYGGALIQIRVPRGTPAAYLGFNATAADDGELVLGRGQRFRVLSVEPSPHHGQYNTRVTVEVVPNDDVTEAAHPGEATAADHRLSWRHGDIRFVKLGRRLREWDPDQPRGSDGRWIEIHGPAPATNPALWQPWEAAVAVDENHRRKGIARTLMQAAMQDGLDVLSSTHETFTPEGLAFSQSLGRDVTGHKPAGRRPGFYELLFHMRAVDKKGPPGVSRETYYEDGDERLRRSDWHAYVYRDENGDPVGALEVYAPYLREAIREAWDESRVHRARTKPGTNRGSFAPKGLAAAATEFAQLLAKTPEQRAADLAARRAARDAFEAEVAAAGYKRRDRVRLKDRPGDFELFDYRYFDGKGVITVAPERPWGAPLETIDTTLDNLAGHSTSPNPADLRNPFTKVHPQYKGPMTVEGYHNGSYEGIAGVRREGFDFSKHKRGTWGVGAYLFTGWGGKGVNPGGAGEDSVPLRATVKNALVVKLDNVGALDRHDPGQAEFDRITRAAGAQTIHEERAAMLAAGYDGLLVLHWNDEPYLMVAYNPTESITILGENDVSSVSGIMAIGDEPPRPGDYNYRAGADTLANRGLLEATLAPATADDLEQREWPDDEPPDLLHTALAIAEAYNPDQPRWPKGHPQAGQWRGKPDASIRTPRLIPEEMPRSYEPSGEVGTIYLLHFNEPFGHAKHYLGWARSLDARLKHHAAGSGANLLRHVRGAGIGWQLARTWKGDRSRERALKARGHARKCPICMSQAVAPPATAGELTAALREACRVLFDE